MNQIPEIIEDLRRRETRLEDKKAELLFQMAKLEIQLVRVEKDLAQNREEQHTLEGICLQQNIQVPEDQTTSTHERIICEGCYSVVSYTAEHVQDAGMGEYFTCQFGR